MVDPVDWDALYAEYCVCRSEALAGWKSAQPFEPSQTAIDRLANPTDDDIRWLIEALRDTSSALEGPKWFAADLFSWSDTWADVFFAPLLDAAFDEVDPSYNRYFVNPCIDRFGPRRVNECLLDIAESGSDFRIAGAVNALYWA